MPGNAAPGAAVLSIPVLRAFAFLWSAILAVLPYMATEGFQLSFQGGESGEEASGFSLLEPIRDLDPLGPVAQRDPPFTPGVPQPDDGPPGPLLETAPSAPPARAAASARVNGTSNESRDSHALHVPRPRIGSYVARFARDDLPVSPGGTSAFSLVFESRSWDNSTLRVSIASATPGWTATASASLVDLPANETTTLEVALAAPVKAKPGTVGRFLVQVVGSDPLRPKFFGATAKVEGVSLPAFAATLGSIDGTRKEVGMGGSAEYSIRVVNRGALSDTYFVRLTDPGVGWRAEAANGSFPLASGESFVVRVKVTAPTAPLEGQTARVNVTILSSSTEAVGGTVATATVLRVTTPLGDPVPEEALGDVACDLVGLRELDPVNDACSELLEGEASA